ncbi:MAG TPA: MFS transporter [Bryobacteraceae bacterium]
MPTERGPQSFWFGVATVSLIAVLEIASSSMVIMAVPFIAHSFHTDAYHISWALAGYFAAGALALLSSDWLVAFFGGSRTLLGAALVFAAASLLCAPAPNLACFVLFSVMQGLTGALFGPLVQTQLLEGVIPARRGPVMAIYALGAIVGSGFGLVLGGYLAAMSWRWIFYIDAAIGLAWSLIYWRFIPPTRRWSQANTLIDFRGLGLFALTLTAIFFGLSISPSLFGWIAVAAGAILLFAFLARTRRSAMPLLALHLLKRRAFSAGSLLTACVGFSLSGSALLLSLFFQGPLGYTSIHAGITLAVRFIGSLIAMPLMGLLSGRVGARKLLSTGLLASSAALFVVSTLNPGSGTNHVFWSLLLLGASINLLFIPLTTVTYDRIASEDIGAAATLLNISRMLGGACAVLLMMSFVSHHNPAGRSFTEAFQGSAWLLVLCLPLLLLFGRRRLPSSSPTSAD